KTKKYSIPDSREGWVEALKLMLKAYFLGKALPVFDFSEIRPAGAPIRGFGGIASGPEPLEDMLNSINDILEKRIDQPIQSVDIVDIMNHIGKCVVAGNVRRSAEIALGEPTDFDFVLCKQDKEKLYSHRWASNNSVFAKKGMDYSFIADQIKVNGEPGVFWLENAQNYSRINEKPDFKDKKVAGVNPCITGDTLIAVADGRNAVPIKKLAEEGKDIPVYCKDTNGLLKIKMMRNPRITGKEKKIYEVKLDDGSIIKCTENHKFILKNLSQKPAIRLKSGDSIMITTKWQTTWSEIIGEEKKKKSPCWILNNGKKNIFEHSFIFEQLNRIKIPKGHVIHHRDHNSLNNNILNLELFLKSDHDSLHDISGDKNPMRQWYSNATSEEKQNYPDKMSEATSGENNPRYSRYTNEEIYEEMINLIRNTKEPLTTTAWKKYAKKSRIIYNFTDYRGSLLNLIKRANIESNFEHLDNPAMMREYKKYVKMLKYYDLELLFDNGIWIVKYCELCKKRFLVKYRERERAYCSNNCENKINALKAGKTMKEKGKKNQKIVREKLYNLFIEYVCDNNEVPNLKKFLSFLKQQGINDLRTAGIYKGYQYVLEQITSNYNSQSISSRSLYKDIYRQEMAAELISNGLCYNHKVISVRFIGYDDVYNGTVDEYHNFGIILNEKKTNSDRTKLEMAFTANCGEQSLESFELCCLVETFPSRHESYEEYEDTLKYAYLYAKSVTLVNTHWKETNAVMLKNRRMGISQTGIIEAFVKHGRRNILKWCEKGYKFLKQLDEQYSDWLCIPKSIKLTTIKPSGCSVGQTLVNTNKGIFMLKELGNKNGEQWQNLKDIKTTATKCIDKFYINGKVKTKIIETSDGNILESSLNHRYKVYQGDLNNFDFNKIFWKDVKEISKGDVLVCILDDYINSNEPELIQVEKLYHNVDEIKQPLKMTPKLAWFIGLFYGDGSVHNKGIRISFNRKHPSLIHSISKIVKELFDIDIVIDDNHSVYLNSTFLLEYLKKNGILKDFCHELEIPLTIRKSSRKSVLSFINGLWRADGGIHNLSTWTICTVSEKFARQLLTLCRSVGLNIKIKPFSPSPGAFGIKDRWIIQSRLKDMTKLRYISKKVKTRYNIINGKKFWFDFVINTRENINYTYDISVPNGNEYLANGVISHNTVSLMPGVPPGIHYPHSEYYIRRIRVSKNSDLIVPLKNAGYYIEDDKYSGNSYVIEFPIHEKNFDRSKKDVSIWEQAENAAAYQKYWSDNQVSITITFKQEEAKEIKHVLECYEDKLKSVSFLPIKEHGYEQAPYEEITKAKYEEMCSKIRPLNLDDTSDRAIGEQFCDSDKCTVNL
ncbi:MAG: HNH endonuclease, partial [Candidatus Lokiarchaeota archaeon]|nr:HNH endonuclease [Candidatus Lokiarchaeota archaeon]